jgi:hypothetical protein
MLGPQGREAIKISLNRLIQARRWLRARSFNFRFRDRDFKVLTINDPHPWPKPSSLIIDGL